MKKTYQLSLILLIITSCTHPVLTTYKSVGDKEVYDAKSNNVLIFTSGLAIDADGSPHAYHPNNETALDYLANAGRTGNWWALVTDNNKKDGNPLIQSNKDPAPGYYISTTSLQDNTKKTDDPDRYVNSESLCYIALPANLSTDFAIGDIACVINKRSNKKCFAIFADIGPSNKIGEGSIFLAQQLGINSSPKKGGAVSDIVYILIKNSGIKTVLSTAKINEIGKSKLTDGEIRQLLRSLSSVNE